MTPQLVFFPVGNGDMTLIVLESGKTILIDINIRCAAADPNESTPNVVKMLKQWLNCDSQGRLYVDVFLLTHPDQDHCRGLLKHFHLGPANTYSKTEDKIFIRELWSSPIVFRRASSILTLCDDAQAFGTEARRRVSLFRKKGVVSDGDRILIMGEDECGKTDDLTPILVKVDELATKVNGAVDTSMTARLLGPLPISNNEEEEEALAKNRSSVILRFDLKVNGATTCLFLTAGDAEVGVWERFWKRHKHTDWLKYDILQAPHHCSWHSLSYDSWSNLGENAKVNQGARSALSQGCPGAVIVASCNPIMANTSDPPCIRAKREYESIAKEVSGRFECTGEYLTKANPDQMVFEIGQHGPRLTSKLVNGTTVSSGGAVGRQPLPHG